MIIVRRRILLAALKICYVVVQILKTRYGAIKLAEALSRKPEYKDVYKRTIEILQHAHILIAV